MTDIIFLPLFYDLHQLCYFVKNIFLGNCANVNIELSSKVSLWRGDITRLEIDSIVNAGGYLF